MLYHYIIINEHSKIFSTAVPVDLSMHDRPFLFSHVTVGVSTLCNDKAVQELVMLGALKFLHS